MELQKTLSEIDDSLSKFCTLEQNNFSAVHFLSTTEKSISKLNEQGWPQEEASNHYSKIFESVLDKLKNDTQVRISEVMSRFQQKQISDRQVKDFMYEVMTGAISLSSTFDSHKLINESTKGRLEHYDNELRTLFTPYIQKKPKGACYIATMAYGDYDHPQVVILREFRDEVLEKSKAGQWLICAYYYFSPLLVEKWKNNKSINKLVRMSLNQFIKLIKK